MGKKYISLCRHDFELKVATHLGEIFISVYRVLPSNLFFVCIMNIYIYVCDLVIMTRWR